MHENRSLAAAAHALPVAGIILGLVAFSAAKDDDGEGAFQGLQAAAYHLVAAVLTVVVWVLWGWLYLAVFIPTFTAIDPLTSAPPGPLYTFGSLSVPLLLIIVLVLGGLYGAQQVRDGHAFRYPLLGAWVEQQAEVVNPPRGMGQGG